MGDEHPAYAPDGARPGLPLVENFRGPYMKKIRGQNMEKFGSILDNFKVQWQISPEWMKIFKIGQVLHRR